MLISWRIWLDIGINKMSHCDFPISLFNDIRIFKKPVYLLYVNIWKMINVLTNCSLLCSTII